MFGVEKANGTSHYGLIDPDVCTGGKTALKTLLLSRPILLALTCSGSALAQGRSSLEGAGEAVIEMEAEFVA